MCKVGEGTLKMQCSEHAACNTHISSLGLRLHLLHKGGFRASRVSVRSTGAFNTGLE